MSLSKNNPHHESGSDTESDDEDHTRGMAMVQKALSQTSKPHLFIKEFYDKLIQYLCKNGTFTPEQTERWLEIIRQFPVPEEESNGPHEGWETSLPTDQSKSDEETFDEEEDAKSEPESQEEEEDEEQRAERLRQEFVAFQARKKKRKQSGGSGESRKRAKPSDE
jgi:hypothetical protein